MGPWSPQASGLTGGRRSLYHAPMRMTMRVVLAAGLWLGLWLGWAGGLAQAIPDGKPQHRGPRTLVVAQDGSGQFTSIQEAIDEAHDGDTVQIKAGDYREDVTIHSKERLTLTGAGAELVKVLGRERVGVFHIGKWPYGATDIDISGLTIYEHGGHAMGIFNGRNIRLHHVRINGMVFGQQVQNVRIEQCDIGGSETTGVQFADSQATLLGNHIHDNDHGVIIAGKSDVRLERNVIVRSLFEGVVVTDKARLALVGNTIVKNGGGAALLGLSSTVASGNIVGLNKVGFLMGPSSLATLSTNALYNSESEYRRTEPADGQPELKGESDILGDPLFVDPAKDDFRLRPETPLVRRGEFAYLGALPPLSARP